MSSPPPTITLDLTKFSMFNATAHSFHKPNLGSPLKMLLLQSLIIST